MIIKTPNNSYISKAVKLLDAPHNTIVKGNTIESKYNSYIASFGGSIIQSGLVATLMIFESNDEKKKIIQILFDLLNHTKTDNEKIKITNGFFFKTIVNKDEPYKKKLRNELIEMAVALKLAMRCYTQVDN